MYYIQSRMKYNGLFKTKDEIWTALLLQTWPRTHTSVQLQSIMKLSAGDNGARRGAQVSQRPRKFAG